MKKKVLLENSGETPKPVDYFYLLLIVGDEGQQHEQLQVYLISTTVHNARMAQALGTPSCPQHEREPCHKPIPKICSIHSADRPKWTGNQAIKIPK